MAKPRTKTVPPHVGAAFREQLRLYVEREFGGNQSSAGKALGFTQSHISSLISGKRSIGLPILLQLRDKTGRSIDEWLGLSPSAASVPFDAIRAIVRAEIETSKGKK